MGNFTVFKILYMVSMEILPLRSATSIFRDATSQAYRVPLLLSFFNIYIFLSFFNIFFLVFLQSQWLYCLACLFRYVYCKCLNETRSLVPPVSVVTKRTRLTTSAELNHPHFPLSTKYKIVPPHKKNGQFYGTPFRIIE